MKKLICIMLVLAMALSMVACAAPAEEAPAAAAPAAEAEAKPAKKWVIGYDNNGLANFFARAGLAAGTDEIAKLGCEMISTVSDGNTMRTANIENFIMQNVDAIIIEEGDVNEVAPALQQAKDAGIVIGSMDGGYIDGVTDVYVSSDNYALGKAVGEMLAEYTGGKGKFISITGVASMIKAREDGAYEVLSQYPEIEIAYTFDYSWPDYYEDVLSKVESALQADPNPGDISGVYACFDGVGIAACDAFKAAGITGEHVSIVGVDGDPDALKLIAEENSPYKATIMQDPDTIARLTVQNVVDILNGKTIEKAEIYLPGITITADNVAEYLTAE